MSENLTHEEIEKYADQIPGGLLDRLPTSVNRESAKGHHREFVRLTHECLEAVEAKPEPDCEGC